MLAQVQRPDERTHFKTVRSDCQLEEALQQLKIAAIPLLAPLTAEERAAAGIEESSSTHNGVQSVTGAWPTRRQLCS